MVCLWKTPSLLLLSTSATSNTLDLSLSPLAKQSSLTLLTPGNLLSRKKTRRNEKRMRSWASLSTGLRNLHRLNSPSSLPLRLMRSRRSPLGNHLFRRRTRRSARKSPSRARLTILLNLARLSKNPPRPCLHLASLTSSRLWRPLFLRRTRRSARRDPRALSRLTSPARRPTRPRSRMKTPWSGKWRMRSRLRSRRRRRRSVRRRLRGRVWVLMTLRPSLLSTSPKIRSLSRRGSWRRSLLLRARRSRLSRLGNLRFRRRTRRSARRRVRGRACLSKTQS